MCGGTGWIRGPGRSPRKSCVADDLGRVRGEGRLLSLRPAYIEPRLRGVRAIPIVRPPCAIRHTACRMLVTPTLVREAARVESGLAMAMSSAPTRARSAPFRTSYPLCRNFVPPRPNILPIRRNFDSLRQFFNGMRAEKVSVNATGDPGRAAFDHALLAIGRGAADEGGTGAEQARSRGIRSGTWPGPG